jgi:SPP1 gp7 family putative phage head morphogenesis protein
MRLYAKEFQRAVLEELARVRPELAGAVRTDAPTAGPYADLFSRVRLRMTQMREKLPFEVLGAEIADHGVRQAEQIVGLKNSDLFLRGLVSKWRRENVDLVTNMTEEMLDRVSGVLEGYDGLRVEDAASALESTFGLTRARAELIARDQTLKLNAQMGEQSQRSAGVTHYRWSTSNDGSVRDDHDALEGQTFSWEEPPITNATEVAKGKPERRCHPGEDYQCRCVPIPVLEEFDDLPEE